MSAIPWTVIDPETIERMIAVGLCRRHKNARRIKASQGDGGLDVLVPTSGQSQMIVENYQVKKFADGLDASRERQIRKSLESAIATHNEQTYRYRISKWILTLPMDLTREQEMWLFDLAADLSAPFPVEIFGLTAIETLLLESPNIREYYIGDGVERLRELLSQMNSLAGLGALTVDRAPLAPNDATTSLADLHQRINSEDPHFDYDYEVTNDLPRIAVRAGLIASVVARHGKDQPYVTWHISTKYDTALEDRPIPGGYTIHPERMSLEQKEAWERWRDYGTPVVLEGDVVQNLAFDLPGGFGGPLPTGDNLLKIGPAIGEFDQEPSTRSLWVIESPEGTKLAERLFSFRLHGRGLGGGEHRRGSDLDGYITADIYTMPKDKSHGSMKLGLGLHGDTWAGQPVQRILPMLRFCAAWGNNNLLRPQDEFGLRVADTPLPLEGEPYVPSVLLAAVEDLVRISTATGLPITLPGNISALAEQRSDGLHIIADTVSGLDTEFGIGELVLWYEDDPSAYADLEGRIKSGSWAVPWRIPFPLLGDDFSFAFRLELSGEVTLEPEAADEHQAGSRRYVRVIPTSSTRGRFRWDRDPTSEGGPPG